MLVVRLLLDCAIVYKSFEIRALLTVGHYYPIQPSQQLMYALECGDYNHIVTWSLADGGLSFFILDTRAFAKYVLAALFKKAKFDSFQRKLYRWGFVKNKRMRGNKKKTMLSFLHPYFRKGDFELALKMTCSGPGSASNRMTSVFTSPPGSNGVLRSTGTDLMVGATYNTATGGYQDTEARNTTNASLTFVDGVRATAPADLLGKQRHRVFRESSLGLRRDPMILSMFGNAVGGVNNKISSGGVTGRLSTSESNQRFYQAPCYHHDPCHDSGGLRNKNRGTIRVRCLPGMDSLHRRQQPLSLRRIATPRQEGRFSSGGMLLSMKDQQSIIQDALDVLQIA